ncbi:MAG: ferrochelatase [Chitinophagales bacterium]|nr:ferrochelatase [Chitinophagales bacterium]
MSKKIGVLLINLGTPDSPNPKDVYKYLLEFLTDKRVIDFGWLKRNLLVRAIIVPARYKNSARTYQAIWDKEKGSPLMYHSQELAKKVQAQLGDDYIVELAMRYQQPSIEYAINQLQNKKVDRIVVVPLYPQYASSSTGTVLDKVMEITKKDLSVPDLSLIKSYYDFEPFIDAWVTQIKKYDYKKYDKIVFSYHGVPFRHLIKEDKSKNICKPQSACCNIMTNENKFCYKAQCHATTRAIVDKLQLDASQYEIAFQSRLGKEVWIEPYTVHRLPELAKEGKKNLLVVAPSFVADCLETLYEIQVELEELFVAAGGEKIQLVESLNSNELWTNAVCELIKQR